MSNAEKITGSGSVRGEVVGAVAHEVHNVLAALLLHLPELAELEPTPKDRALLESLEAEVQQAAKLLQSLEWIARPPAAGYRPFPARIFVSDPHGRRSTRGAERRGLVMTTDQNAEDTMTTRGKSDRGSILIVDDTIKNLRLLVRILEEHGYETRPLTSGREALQSVERTPPDLVLLDIDMPEMDGYEVCRRLKEQEDLRDIPVLFLSGLTGTADKLRGFEVGGVDFITKPFQINEVLARIRTHLALRRSRLDLAQSYERLRKLEDLRDHLVHMIAHDIRSPLMALMANLEFLLMGPAGHLGDGVTRGLRAAERIAEEIYKMVNDLLDIRRLEEGKMPVERSRRDLAEIAAKVRESFSRLPPRREIDFEAAGPVEVVCDGALLQRVIENLVGNAIKHTPPEGRLVMTIERGPDRVRVAVHDEGPGIPPEAREQIFEAYGTLRARTDGTYHSAGLGLAFCKLAVEAHGGTLGVESGEEGGSTFWFELPL